MLQPIGFNIAQLDRRTKASTSTTLRWAPLLKEGMNSTTYPNSYAFSAEENSLLQSVLRRLITHTGVRFQCSIALVMDSQAFVLRVSDDKLGIDRDLVVLQAIVDGRNPPNFAVMDFEGRQVGPGSSYGSFLEALGYAENFAGAVVEAAKEQRLKRQPISPAAEIKKPVEQPAPKAREVSAAEVVRSGVLSRHDVDLIESFTKGLGRTAQAEGFCKFLELQADFLSIGLGILHRDAGPVVLGTLVIVADGRGGHECSIKGVLGKPIPTLEGRYASVASTLTPAVGYFRRMAESIGTVTRPSLLQRIGQAMGFGRS